MRRATIRDLRNRFPEVKKLVEAEGTVIVTDNGEPRYKLMLYTPESRKTRLPAKDYLARLVRHQPRPLDPEVAETLREDNRGER